MKAILIIAHHCILPGAYKGFEEIMDKLHHDLPGTRVASTSLLDLENDLRTLLREDVESVTLLPYLLLNGQHTKNCVFFYIWSHGKEEKGMEISCHGTGHAQQRRQTP